MVQATASDPEDGELTGGAIVWSSSLDGSMGTAQSVTRADLSLGVHTVTATARDAAGAEASDDGSFTIKAARGSWTRVGDMSAERTGAKGILLEDGSVLVVGGCCSTEAGQSAELFHPRTGSFTSAGTTRSRRSQGHTATRLLDGTVLIVGGVGEPRTAEIYDPATRSFTSVAQTHADRRHHSVTLLADGRVLLAGGSTATPEGSVGHTEVEIYDPDTRSFTPTASLSTDRTGAASVWLADGRVAFLGGARTTTPGFAEVLSSTEIFDSGASPLLSKNRRSTDHRLVTTDTPRRFPTASAWLSCLSSDPGNTKKALATDRNTALS